MQFFILFEGVQSSHKKDSSEFCTCHSCGMACSVGSFLAIAAFQPMLTGDYFLETGPAIHCCIFEVQV